MRRPFGRVGTTSLGRERRPSAGIAEVIARFGAIRQRPVQPNVKMVVLRGVRCPSLGAPRGRMRGPLSMPRRWVVP